MEQLVLAYTMTGDKRYADRAKVLLAEVVNHTAWDGMDDRTPRWNAGLGTSHTNWTTSVTYDAIYNSLTTDERKEIANKILKLGIQPTIDDWLSKDKRIQSVNNMGHNWWAAIVFEAGTASLAVMDKIPSAQHWAQEIMEDSKQWFSFNGSVLENKPASFDPDGGFYESVGYANYGVSEYLLFRLDRYIEKLPDWYANNQPKPGECTTFSVWKNIDKNDPLLESGLLSPVNLLVGVKQRF